MYISSEFQLGQVYMGDESTVDDIILYRPVYACVPHERRVVTNIVRETKDSSFAQSKQENSVSETHELMLKPLRTNNVNESEAENKDQNKTSLKVVPKEEPSDCDNTISASTFVQGGDTDVIQDLGTAADEAVKETKEDVS